MDSSFVEEMPKVGAAAFCLRGAEMAHLSKQPSHITLGAYKHPHCSPTQSLMKLPFFFYTLFWRTWKRTEPEKQACLRRLSALDTSQGTCRGLPVHMSVLPCRHC